MVSCPTTHFSGKVEVANPALLSGIGMTEMNLMKPIEDTQESLVQDFSLPVLGILTSAAIGDPTGISAAVIPIIVREVFRQVINPLTTRGESKRLYQWGKQAAEGIVQRLNDGEEFRKDGFFEETPTNRSNFEEVVESTLKMVMAATEEPKVKFMASLTEHFHFDADLDMDTYRQILKDLNELTYRQLCIIRLISLGDREVHIDPINDIEQVPQNERTRFYSIGRDYVNLMDNHYIIGSSVPTLSDNPFLSNPGSGQLPDYTKRLERFANLHEIPFEDIEKTLSLWNVRPRKSE